MRSFWRCWNRNGKAFDRPEAEANRRRHKHSPEVLRAKAKWTERRLINPTPGLPDDTPIENGQLPARIRNAMAAADLKTVGEIRKASDDMLLTLPDLGDPPLDTLDRRSACPGPWEKTSLRYVLERLAAAPVVDLSPHIGAIKRP
jgi:DNA-directed RNA polymerase alpha subunit